MDVAKLTATEMLDSFDAGKLSVRDAVESCLKAVEAEQALNSYITLRPASEVLADADQAQNRRKLGQKGALLGVPIAIKDAIITKNLRTTAGSKMLENFIPPYDATVITKLRDAGAIIVGKTNMDEFAMGSSTENSGYGPVKNPWDTKVVPGGSSGGSAATVAAHSVPLSLGSDTGGSIRQPASFCNLFGFKPTYGRVSRYGLVAFASSLDSIGPFARSVRDTALLLQVISGHDPKDSTSVDTPVPDFVKAAQPEKSLKGLRFGIPREYFTDDIAPSVKSAVRAAIDQIANLGGEIRDITLPHTDAGVAVYYVVAPAEASSNLARYDGVRYGYREKSTDDLHDMYARSRSHGFGREVQRRILVGTYVLSSGYIEAYYGHAMKVRSLIARDFANAFEKECDVILAPTAPTTAFPLGAKTNDPVAMYLNDVFTIPTSLAGLPALNIPCGFDEASLPIGLQLVGKPFAEETLFKVAASYEAQTDWHKRAPRL